MLIDSNGIGEGSLGESGPSLPLPPGDTNHSPKPPLVPDFNKRALRRLISRTVPQHELLSVIETIFSNVKAANTIKYLEESDAQTFIDIVDEACHRYSITEKLTH